MITVIDAMRNIPPYQWCLRVGLVLTGLLLVSGCDSSVGLRRAPNPWTQHCVNSQAFVSAVERQDQAAIQAAVAALRSDIAPMERDSPAAGAIAQTIADQAAGGDVAAVQQHLVGNCLPITPVPVQTTESTTGN